MKFAAKEKKKIYIYIYIPDEIMLNSHMTLFLCSLKTVIT